MLLTERIAPTGADNVFSICAATAMRAPKHLSPRHGAGREISKLRRLVARLRALRPGLVLRHIVRRRRIEQRSHLFLHRRDPVGHLAPLGAVPLHHVSRLMAVVIGAGHGERRAELGQAKLLPARRGDVHRLESAPHILAGHDFLAGELLRVADRFRDHHGVVDALVVVRLPNLFLRRLALALVDDGLEDVLDRREVRTHRREVQSGKALGLGAGRTRVILTTAPPDADEFIHREADAGGFLHRGRIHRAPAPHDHPRRLVAPDVEPEAGLVLHFGRRHRIELHVEAVVLSILFEQRDRLAAIAAVEENKADGLALELVETALLAADIAEDHGQAVPVGRRRIKHPGKIIADGRGRQAVGHRQDRDLVDRGFRDHFFFNDTAPPEIYTLSLHDALPISTASPPLMPISPFWRSASPPQSPPTIRRRRPSSPKPRAAPSALPPQWAIVRPTASSASSRWRSNSRGRCSPRRASTTATSTRPSVGSPPSWTARARPTSPPSQAHTQTRRTRSNTTSN